MSSKDTRPSGGFLLELMAWFGLKSVALLNWNRWRVWIGMTGRIGPEYAGKRDNLDDKLADFVTGLAAAIESIRTRNEEHARQRARWEEEARIREEMERKRREEEALRAQLLKEATAWRDAELCLEYLKHVKARLGDSSVLSATAREWLLQVEQVLAVGNPIYRRVQVLRTAL